MVLWGKMIKFYAPRDPFGCFSNFSRHPVKVFGHTFTTSEHAFQAYKFHPHRPDLFEKVRDAASPTACCNIARDRSNPIRPDWDDVPDDAQQICPVINFVQPQDGIVRPGVEAEPVGSRVKDLVMLRVVLLKFQQNKSCKEELLSTAEEPLVEDALHDPYWGWGSSRIGENKLGRILMVVRGILR